MKILQDLYTIKSFICLGDSLNKCYGCDYCRADDNIEHHYHILPESINPLFDRLPIAVNLFYGDPTLQWENTLSILRYLEANQHKGVIMIVTKGKLRDIPTMNLNLHVGISYGPDEISQRNIEYNLQKSQDSWYHYSIEYRPICNGVNDSDDIIEKVFSLSSLYGNVPISYCGLQLPPFQLPNKYKPYDNRPFSGQKYISEEINNRIKKYSQKYNVPIFHKTSCMLSYTHNLSYDYNIHFMKPIGTECASCLMRDKCKTFAFKDVQLPFEYEIFETKEYTCSFVKNGLCQIPNKECLKMQGLFIKPHLHSVTRGDVRIIKWLTGCMVADVPHLIETPYISGFWKM